MTDVLVAVIVVLLVVMMAGFVVAARRVPLGRGRRPPAPPAGHPSEPPEVGTALGGRGARRAAPGAGKQGRRYGPQPGRGGGTAPPAEGPVPPAAAPVPPAEGPVPPAAAPVPPAEGPPAEVVEASPEGRVAAPPSFRDRLARTRDALAGSIVGLRGRSHLDERAIEDLEEALILADVGLPTTARLLEDLRATARSGEQSAGGELTERLKAAVADLFEGDDPTLNLEPGTTNVWLFVGVNGAGKTTTIGKLAAREVAAGRRVVLGAGDTFRAAAADQLELWAERSGASIVRGAEGADPSSVVFDAVQHAAARNADLVLADSAGRLHTKVNLMEELRKLRRVADRPPGHVSEVLLVLDATTGQNGLVQARQFSEAVGVTGVVLTKLDGTAKGGIAIAIRSELGLPIKLVGLGEGPEDLVEFDPEEFAEALFGYEP